MIVQFSSLKTEAKAVRAVNDNNGQINEEELVVAAMRVYESKHGRAALANLMLRIADGIKQTDKLMYI